ncbi:MAG: flippase-like domain-containing protein [Chloroflexi bacterium]|nr:flippase-like domain-containing protein [Chloroflexota bacterium]
MSAAATALLLYVVDPWAVIAALQQAEYRPIVGCALLVPAALWLRCLRWRLLFPRPREIPLGRLSEALYIGYMMNVVLPLRAGELVRAMLAADLAQTSRSTSVATVAVEKLLDVGAMALLLFVLGQLVPDLPASARYAAGASGLGLALAIGCTAVALLARRQVMGFVRRLETRLPRCRRIGLTGLLDDALDGLAFLHVPTTVTLVMLLTVAQWVVSAAMVALGLIAVGIGESSPQIVFQMTLLVLVATNLSMAIPSAPGYVGVFHGVFVATLVLFGVNEDVAAAAAVLEHAVIFGSFIVGGVYYLVAGRATQLHGRRLGAVVLQARSSKLGAN